jgi:UDP-glucose 4-epimerase
MAKVLVVGGAGYVGSTTAFALKDLGHEVIVLDSLGTGHPELACAGLFVQGDMGNRAVLDAIFSSQKIDTVFHFAAKTVVSESVQFPDEYRENNVVRTSVLLDAMIDHKVLSLVFSSTCAIFGEPTQPISEDASVGPLSPYGENKAEVESLLQNRYSALGMRSVALRYFNASGAEEELRTGEWHDPETHLIPRVIQAIKSDHEVAIFGADYPTVDGTCVRDYVHVSDLADAHVLAMKRLQEKKDGGFEAFNLGTEMGSTVLQVITEVERVIGTKARLKYESRRAGDAVSLVADAKKARSELGWRPSRPLETIVRSAVQFEEVRQGLIDRRVIILDRDGTLNPDPTPGYINDPDRLSLFPGVGEALGKLKAAGYTLVLATNQSGVGRGLITPQELEAVHIRLQELLLPFAAQIDYFAMCIHHPDSDCACRKPKIELIQRASGDLKFKIEDAIYIGDRPTDLRLAENCGAAGAVLVRTGHGSETEAHLDRNSKMVVEVYDGLKEWADQFLASSSKN